MVMNKKKKPLKGARARRAEKLKAREDRKRNQQKMNWGNVAAVINHAQNTLRGLGVDVTLIEILKLVRQWLEQIEETGPDAITPPFSATEISAEEVMQDDERIINASFSYSGETYDLTYKPGVSLTKDEPFGTFTLQENGKQVVSMLLIQDLDENLFGFHKLNGLHLGAWIDNMVSIKAEIDLHRDNEDTASPN
jgi:hypothetical protein